MLSVDEYLEALYPKLYLAATKDTFVQIATSQTSKCAFGDQYNYAIALRACHNYYIMNDRGSVDGGSVTGKTDGRIAMNFWNNTKAGDNSGLNLSTYGQTLQSLISSLGLKASISSTCVEFLCSSNSD